MKNLSIRTLALRHIAVLLLSVLTIIVLSFILLIGQLQEKQQQEHQHKAKLIASNISQLIGFYREITQDLAKQPQVIELIRSGNSEKAQQWSIQTRSLLPNSNGLALLTNDGSFLGNPKSQKVGALCKKDLLLRKEGKLEIMPPIHYPSGKMSHFDIVTPVYLEDKAIGVLFASFSLEIIQRITQQLQHDEEHLLIQTIQQLKVAEVGVHHKNYKHSNITINGSNWVLNSEIPPFKIEGFFTTYLSATLVLLLIIIIATALFAIRLGKIFIQDMQGVKQALAGVQKGEFL
ncbi:MAG: hypothetical protein GQ569_07920, partial [Methylococcaceae bacterium]|nr:hypothetical protein [Methylococcaceae bacterium]